MKSSKTRLVALLLAALFLLSACGSTANSADDAVGGSATEDAAAVLRGTYSFNAGSSSPEGGTIDLIMKYVSAQLEQQTNNQLQIQHFGASQLGGDADLVNEVQAGDVPIAVMTTASLVSAVPELGVFDLYGAIPSTEVFTSLMQDPEFFALIQSWFENAGLHLLFYCPSNYKYLGGTKLFTTAEDFQGVSMRTLPNANQIAFWDAAGANTLQVTATELYLAIQQGLVEGLEMDLHGFINFSLEEVLSYVYDSRLVPHMTVAVMNLDAWNSIAPEDQAWFNAFLEDVDVKYAELGAEADAEAWEELESAGVQRVDFNEELFTALQDIAKENEWPLVREAIGDDVVDAYLGYVDAAIARVG